VKEKENMILLILAAILAAAAILCGYTTVRLPVRRKDGKQHIAFVGDSVTYGCTLPMFFIRRYPAVLQKLLGSEAQVAAFAVNDRTLQSTGNKPYREEKAFQQSKAFLPDAVVILLGTNDSKDANWISDEAFRQQYRELINEYRALPKKPRILLCTPPFAFAPINRFFYITNDAKLDRIPEIAALVRAVAEEQNLETVDLYAQTEGRRDLFGPDGLHPNAAGAKLIADTVYRALNHQNDYD
jgi:lysophospholipase L1-like esterase